MKLEIITKAKAFIDGTSYVLKIVDNFDSWDHNTQLAYIDESFFNMINYCFKNVPYYHKLFIDYGLNPKDATNISYINRIPILTKDIIRSNYNTLRSNELYKLKYQVRRSGGTTGEPIKSLVSVEAAAFELFTYFKGLRWMGWKQGMTTVRLFGGSLGIGGKANIRQFVYQTVTDSISIPAFELDSNRITQYFDLIKSKRNLCIIGYASAINIFVDLLKSKSFVLTNVKLVITTSEQLIDDWKNNIETYFNCKIRSYYGCGEIGSLGYQLLNEDQKYKIPAEHVHIESDNATSELYITQLHNKAQPLLRYANGDLGNVIKNNSWYIENFYGRTSDLFKRRNGVSVSPNFGAHAILKSGIPVLRYQYIQYSDYIIEFRYVMEHGELTPEHKSTLQKIINYVMGENMEVHFIESNAFEVSKSGKHRITVTVERPFHKKRD